MPENDIVLDNADYTVGIICALGLEMNAVRHHLDREHRSLPVSSQDSTLYILGEINKHYTVIACLPGNQGKSAAAIAVTNMARAFQSIKHRILVGIGGEAPSARSDIRLGDVVVSMASNVHGGVVQYDFGKDTETGFVRKGYTSPPPSVLRGAVQKMQVEYVYQPGSEGCWFESACTAFPRPSAPDILFNATYPHQPGRLTCDQCDVSMGVQRPVRDDGAPRIFYGLIASGDRVVKSAVKRDAMVEEIGEEVLCFEMEAAGMMDEFPAVVIRGISDYADSHKNDSWQPYAAACAAACAKKLLSHLEPERPRHTNTLGAAPGGSNDLLDQFLADISESDPQNEMTRIRQSKGSLIAECNSWIIQSAELQEWQTNAESNLLWMKGGPGKGKTMAMISLIDLHTRQAASRRSFCYFFCQNNIPHLNNAISVLRALIWKLLWTNHGLCEYIPNEYRCKRDHRKEIFDSHNAFPILTTMLSAILGDASLEDVWILIDGIDECDNGREELLEWILQQLSDPSTKAKWLLSSRCIPRIEELLRPGKYKVCIDLDSNEARVSDAVSYYVEYKLSEIADRKGLSSKHKQEVQAILTEKSESTFLWVALVCQRLQATSRRKIKKELEALPSGLGPLYDRMLQQLESLDDEEDREFCKRILRAVILALRPLSINSILLLWPLRCYRLVENL